MGDTHEANDSFRRWAIKSGERGEKLDSASRDAEVAELRAQLARVTEERDRAAESYTEALTQLDQARRELDAVRAANESVAVCAEHTSRVIGDGCLVCELDAVRERVRSLADACAEDPVNRWLARELRAIDGGDS